MNSSKIAVNVEYKNGRLNCAITGKVLEVAKFAGHYEAAAIASHASLGRPMKTPRTTAGCGVEPRHSCIHAGENPVVYAGASTDAGPTSIPPPTLHAIKDAAAAAIITARRLA